MIMLGKPKIAPAIALLGFLALAATVTGAAVYMKLGDIKGESTATDNEHKDWIIIESLSTSMNVSPTNVSTGTGAARRRGDAIVEDISMTKSVDKSSPKLAEAVCKGAVIPKVEIYVTASYSDEGREPYYKYELTNVMVTSYSVNASGSDAQPTENITLNFEEIKVSYDQEGLKSKKKGKVEYSWKIEEGQK
jgi:type VI secretion system secreted protein Hcp